MTSPFFNGRRVIKADELVGPRVYSTDLLPSLYDVKKLDESVAVAARSLKIKITELYTCQRCLRVGHHAPVGDHSGEYLSISLIQSA